jgi:hypothetical protein
MERWKILEDWKIKISVLWLFTIVVGLASGFLALMEPDVIANIVNKGEIEGMKIGPELLLLYAIVILVPTVMAFLSLTLKDSTNRWANIIVGIIWIGFSLNDLSAYLAKQSAYSAYSILMWLSGRVATALIVWYAWKSKQKG